MEVVGGDGVVALTAFKLRLLLAVLLVNRGQLRSAEALADALWDGAPPPSAQKVLQTYISQLRRLLPRELAITTRDSGYLLEVDGSVLDSDRFERLLSDGRQAAAAGNHALAASLLRRGLAVWRGSAFGDLAVSDAVRVEAERLEELRLEAAEELFAAELELGQAPQVLVDLRSAAAANPFRERLHGQLMLALYRSGQQAEALDVYRATRELLAAELGLEPGPELRELERRILRHDETLVPAVLAEPAAGALPVPHNRLRGRERELAELLELVAATDLRLLVLTGAGGSGKTRLALEVAREAAATFANGATFVDLAAVRDPSRLSAAIAAGLGIKVADDDPLPGLADVLGPREQLVVLDNLEQLRQGAPALVELLARAPRLTLLVTSRVVLHLSGEHVYPVEPLAEEDAVALFVERARAADARFTAGDDEIAAVSRICERLDRLPLAIELAAGRARMFTLPELDERLAARLPFLIGGPHDLAARQQTLRATVEWSLDLLSEEQRADLAGLSVFAGGCDLAATAAVVGATPERISSLVDDSLLIRTPTPHGSRFQMLETIRELMAERLETSADVERLKRAHAEHALRVAESLGLSADSTGTGVEERYELARLEQDNLRAALDWCADADPALGLRIAVALMKFWVAVGPSEGAHRLAALLAGADDAPSDLRARALRDLGGCVQMSARGIEAEPYYRASLELYGQLGDEVGVLTLRYRLAIVAQMRGDLPGARALAEAALADARRLDAHLEEARILDVLGHVTYEEGDLVHAYELMSSSLAISEQLGGWKWGDTIAHNNLSDLACRLGRPDDAEAHALEALALSAETRDRTRGVAALANLALVARARGDDHRAGILWGAIEAEEARSDPEGWSAERADYLYRVVEGAGGAFEQGREEGLRLTYEEASTYAAVPG